MTKQTKVKQEQVAAKPEIEVTAESYKEIMLKVKQLSKEAEGFKTKLLEYADSNREKFENKKLQFGCGVFITIRDGVKVEFDKDAVDMDFIKALYKYDNELSILKIGFDKNSIDEMLFNDDIILKKLLRTIDYKATETETLVVNI